MSELLYPVIPRRIPITVQLFSALVVVLPLTFFAWIISRMRADVTAYVPPEQILLVQNLDSILPTILSVSFWSLTIASIVVVTVGTSLVFRLRIRNKSDEHLRTLERSFNTLDD